VIFNPLAFGAAVKGWGLTPRRNIAISFGVEELEWWGYQTVKTFLRNRLDRTPACEGQTDISCHGIVSVMHRSMGRAVNRKAP